MSAGDLMRVRGGFLMCLEALHRFFDCDDIYL